MKGPVQFVYAMASGWHDLIQRQAADCVFLARMHDSAFPVVVVQFCRNDMAWAHRY